MKNVMLVFGTRPEAVKMFSKRIKKTTQYQHHCLCHRTTSADARAGALIL